MTEKHTLIEGDDVTYADINLRYYSGVITSIGPTKNGGNCLVKWNNFPFVSEEYLPNLRRSTESC